MLGQEDIDDRWRLWKNTFRTTKKLKTDNFEAAVDCVSSICNIGNYILINYRIKRKGKC